MPEAPNPKLRDVPSPAKPAGASSFAYAELDVKTNFSFLRGASHPDELVYRAAELGYRAIAVTDFNSLAGVVRAHEAAKEAGIQLLVGSRLAFSDAPDLLVWAPNRPAYARLCRLLTLGKRRAEKGECALQLVDFIAESDGLLAAVVDGSGECRVQSAEIVGSAVRNVFATGAKDVPHSGTYGLHSALCTLHSALGADRLSLAVSCAYGPDDVTRLARSAELSRHFGVPLLATNDVYYHDPGRRMLQDVLTCVRHGCDIREAGFKLFSNGERYLKTPEQMHRLFADHPQALRRGLEISERCAFRLDELRYEYPDELSTPGKTANEYLSELAWNGAAARYPAGIPEKVRGLLKHELALIEQLRFEHYFLTVYDLVTFARSRGILCQGRGSAANSAVCYCLGITSVDPAKIDLLFERFISAARGEPPDIDVDFEHERREEVIQYLYDKYGRDRAAMTAEVITYRGRSAVRDVGKALGLSLDMVDSLAGKLDWWHKGVVSDEQIRETGLDPADRTIRQVMALATDLLGFPRHLSQHVGGMVMTRGPLCEMVPIENASMNDRTVIEWDKDDIDAIGILKVDVLALGMLTCISKAFALIEKMRPTNSHRFLRINCAEDTESTEGTENTKKISLNSSSFSVPSASLCSLRNSPVQIYEDSCRFLDPPLQLHTVPQDDPLVYDMISNADTVGVFQVESRAQMSMLPRLRPRCFYDLVIEVAIVRPGPIQGDMVHPYLRRRAGLEPVTFPSEALRNVLEKTLGVPLFQEQAMRVAMVGAGFTAEEADKLRRVMAAWRRTGAIEKFHVKIVEGMVKNGYTPQFAEQCFNQIRGFGEYGFPESHAASFALLVYVSAWLKCHHPAAFAAALLNSQPMGFYMPAQIVRDAKEHGVEVGAVDVNASEWDCTLEGSGFEVRGSGNSGPLAPVLRGEGWGEGPSVGVEDSGEDEMRNPSAETKEDKTRIDTNLHESSRMNCAEGTESAEDTENAKKMSLNSSSFSAPSASLRPLRSSLVTIGEDSHSTDGPQCGPYTDDEKSRPLTLGPSPQPSPPSTGEREQEGPALRLGFRQLKGFRQDHATPIAIARKRIARFTSISQFHRLTGLPVSAVRILAEADAFGSLNLSRREALWQVMKLNDEYYPLFDDMDPQEPAVELPKMPAGQEVMIDYATAGLSLKQHPVSLLREELAKRKIITAAELMKVAHNRWVKVAGLVLIRQRPGTASGVVFETLEDETGVVNLIVHPKIYDQYRPAARHARLLQADGYVQRQGQIVHVLPKRLFDLSELLEGYQMRSRDFH